MFNAWFVGIVTNRINPRRPWWLVDPGLPGRTSSEACLSTGHRDLHEIRKRLYCGVLQKLQRQKCQINLEALFDGQS